MPENQIQEVLAHWTDAPKFIDHDGIEFVCRIVSSDRGGVFADFCCFETINCDARESSLNHCCCGLCDGGSANIEVSCCCSREYSVVAAVTANL